MFDKTNSINLEVWDHVWYSVYDSVGEYLWNSVEDAVQYATKASVQNSTWDSIEGAVDTAVQACVRESVYNYFIMNSDKIISKDEYLLRL
jgi:ABC-type uncharacterized transport system permease subunit